MLAIALILDGAPSGGCGTKLRNGPADVEGLVNDQGLPGLSNDTSKGGRRPRLTAEQKAELAGIVRKGPDRAVHGVVRWRRIDPQAVIRDRFAVELAERTIGTILHQLGFRRLAGNHERQAH